MEYMNFQNKDKINKNQGFVFMRNFAFPVRTSILAWTYF